MARKATQSVALLCTGGKRPRQVASHYQSRSKRFHSWLLPLVLVNGSSLAPDSRSRRALGESIFQRAGADETRAMAAAGGQRGDLAHRDEACSRRIRNPATGSLFPFNSINLIR